MTITDHQLFMIHADIQTNADSNAKFLVRASFLEIYNERISDLMVRIVAMHVTCH